MSPVLTIFPDIKLYDVLLLWRHEINIKPNKYQHNNKPKKISLTRA